MKGFVIATLAGIMLITTSAFAQNNRGNVQSAREKMRMFRESLTDEQIEQIKDIRQDWQKKAIQIRADVRVAQIELRDLIDDESASESRIRSQLEKISSSQIDIKMGGIALRNGIKSVLTQEQLENLPDRRFGRNYSMMGHRGRLGFQPGLNFHKNMSGMRKKLHNFRGDTRGINRNYDIRIRRNSGDAFIEDFEYADEDLAWLGELLYDGNETMLIDDLYDSEFDYFFDMQDFEEIENDFEILQDEQDAMEFNFEAIEHDLEARQEKDIEQMNNDLMKEFSLN